MQDFIVRMVRMSKTTTADMKRRMAFVVAMLAVVCSVVLIVRLFYLQILDKNGYRERAINQQLKSVTISAKRGVIYDRNMKKLAQSATVWTVFISPREMTAEQTPLIAGTLSEMLEVDAQRILDKAQDKSRAYEVIKSKIEKPLADEVLSFVNENKISGVYLEEDNKRYYPYGSFAASVIGFTNADNQGSGGVEASYNKILSGTPGRVVSAKNGWGTDMNFNFQQMYEASDGNSIVLTIDEVVQHFLEKHLETAVIEHNIQNSAAGIVMDVETGEILAMATMPDFDPNHYREIKDPVKKTQLEQLKAQTEQKKSAPGISEEDIKALDKEYLTQLENTQYYQWRNKAVSDPYEPGSVFKLITASSALEEGAVKVEDRFHCPGFIIVGPERIGCWQRAGHGSQNFSDGLKNSCNPVFITVGQRLGAEAFSRYFQAFGLAQKTGIDLPGEADNGSLVHKKYGIVELASSSMGQTFKVTPIQFITAIAATVNGGNLYQPHVVKQILDPQGNVIENIEPKLVRQVISEEVSQLVAKLSERVVTEGSGKNAYIPGYRVGGKTGTSQKIDILTQTGERKYVVSFLGFAPADDPKIAVLVMLDEPTIANPYGSVIAAPVVGAVLGDVLPYLGIEPKYTAEELEKIDVTVPGVVGQKPHYAQSLVTQQGLKSRIVGSGDTVLRQIPAASQPMPRGGTVLLYTEQTSEGATLVKVPDVVNLTGKQANQTILNAGLNIKIAGSGIEGSGNYAIRQNPPAGTEVEKGTVITVDFINKENLE